MQQNQQIPRIVLAGVSSGAGKTTLAVALVAALRARGLEVAAFKVGPDYLDPGYLRMASGRLCHNLDGWMMGREAVLGTLLRETQGADVAVIEGVMGLFDGAVPTSEVGSTAEVAKWLQAPTLLAIDAGGMARTFAAVASGLARFDVELNLTGCLANRVGSEGHLELLRAACEGALPVLGGLPRREDLGFSERHLGLSRADEAALPREKLATLAGLAEEWIDLDEVIRLAQAAPELGAPKSHSASAPRSRDVRIGIARDEAFFFYYPENLRLLEEAGAELVEFSPLTDTTLPEVDGLLLGGGYPELFAAKLADNEGMKQAVQRFADSGRPIYAECGGMMYLQRSLETVAGQQYPMVGIFDGRAVMQTRRVALGYVEVELGDTCLLGHRGVRFRGHQFRYSDVMDCSAPDAYSIRSRRGRNAAPGGYRVGSVLGSYVHGHWASHPKVAENFVLACSGRVFG